MTNNPAPQSKPVDLSLLEVACWQLPELMKLPGAKQPSILAALPSLQRGAVWRPNQIELLWDSILRGFPIGSLVVCDRLEKQDNRLGAISHGNIDKDKWNNSQPFTHHLLDGQQRINAVALGFLDPYPDTESPSKDIDADTLLWLDLSPDGKLFPQASTRSHLLRVTTQAHPWGFRVGEAREPERLAAEDARKAMKAFQTEKRPRPNQGWPYMASIPIPLAWLLKAAHMTFGGASDTPVTDDMGIALWREVLKRCDGFIENRAPSLFKCSDHHDAPVSHWVLRARDIIDPWIKNHEGTRDQWWPLVQALVRAVSCRLVALPVPTEALTQPSRLEALDNTSNQERIANVEHLFQRLNAGGTELRGDELAYSMIKAYWPGIEQTIQGITTRPPETQVALLGAQLALDSDDGKYPPPLTVPSLRALANIDGRPSPSDDTTQKLRIEKRKDELNRIKAMFSLHDTRAAHVQKSKAPIALALEQFDEWFLYCDSQKWGLPPVLRSRMAEQAPEVFLFLLRLTNLSGAKPSEEDRKRLLGLSTALHWFGKDRQRAVRWLWARAKPAEWCDGSAFTRNANEQYGLLKVLRHLPDEKHDEKLYATVADILTPKKLGEYIALDTLVTEKIAAWRWWDTLVKDQAAKYSEKPDERWAKFGDLISMLAGHNYKSSNGLLLMYAQREQMAHRFSDYDRSHVGYWDAHNVPWDFDHILAQNVFANMKKETGLLEVCKQWGYTIANLHVSPFEENRSRQDEAANKSLSSNPGELKRMLLWDQNAPGRENEPLDAFSLNTEEIRYSTENISQNADAPAKVAKFAVASRARLLRIYSDWYESLHIGDLL